MAVITRSVQVINATSASKRELSYYRLNSSSSIEAANFDLLDLKNGTFTRGSEASFMDPRYLWTFQGSSETDNWKSTNVPRIFDDGAILIEGARTNALPYSVIESHWLFSFSSGALTTGPDGSNNTATVLSGSSQASLAIYLSALGTQTITSSFSAFHKADTTKNWRWYYRSGSTEINKTAATSSANWERAAIAVNDFDNRMGWKNGTDGDTNEMYLYGLQSETGSFPTSHIRTSGSTRTRAIDICTISASNVPTALRSERQTWTVWPSFAHDESPAVSFISNVFSYSSGGANGGLEFAVQSTGTTRVGIKNAAGGLVVSTTAATWGRHQRLEITYNPGTGDMGIAGATTGNGDYAPGIAAETFEGDLRIGRIAGTSAPWFGVIGRPRRA